jgi:hypothetical protein
MSNTLVSYMRENRRGNPEWKIQKHWPHWVHNTQNQDKHTKTKNKTQTTKKMSNTDPIKNSGGCEAVAAS